MKEYTLTDAGLEDNRAECCAFYISPSLPPAHEGDRRDLGKLWVPTYTRDIDFNGRLDDDARPRSLSHVFERAAEAAAFHFRMGSFAEGDRIYLRHGGAVFLIGHVNAPDRIEVRNARTGRSAQYERQSLRGAPGSVSGRVSGNSGPYSRARFQGRKSPRAARVLK